MTDFITLTITFYAFLMTLYAFYLSGKLIMERKEHLAEENKSWIAMHELREKLAQSKKNDYRYPKGHPKARKFCTKEQFMSLQKAGLQYRVVI